MDDDADAGSPPDTPPSPDPVNRSLSLPTEPASRSRPHRRTRFDLPPLTDPASAGTTRSNSPEPLATPTLAESVGQLKKNLSFTSLRQLEVRELSEHIYRRGSRADKRRYEPKNDDEVFAHALRGGIRSLILGSSLRAFVNLVIVLLRLTKKRGVPAALVLRALFGTDTIRFGGMLGIFTFLYKWTLHTLRLYNIGTKGPGNEEVWHAALAGAVSGLAVWAEKPSRRVTIGQQLFVRGLQGQYNILKSRGIINVKNVSVIVFGLSCAQIMYSWLMAPEALPSGYRRWITQASRVSEPCIPVNLSAHREGRFDPDIARRAITWGRGATKTNKVLIEAYAQRGEKGDFGPPFAPCEVVHPWIESCRWNGVDRWQAVFRWIAPVYAGLHFIPPIILRRKAFLRDPRTALLKSLLGTLRSCSFLATFVTLFQGLVCFQRTLYYSVHGKVPEWIERIVVHKFYYWLTGFSTCLALFIEEKKRRRELAMYVLPRGLESLWSVLRRRSYVPFVPGGEIMLTSFGLALVMQTYQHEPQMLSGLVRTLLYQFVGHG
ncbi:hypothetical protein JCM8097_004613 [Rhodosporidiobolus ruineniae]